LSWIEQLTNAALQDSSATAISWSAPPARDKRCGRGNRAEPRFQLSNLINSLREFDRGNLKVPLIDRDDNRCTATDTRLELRRFIANANVWTTFRRAIELGVVRLLF
jgi:hypothetical protein